MSRWVKSAVFSSSFLVLSLCFCFFLQLSQPVETHVSSLTVVGLSQPFDVAIAPNGEYAYVTNGGTNTVSAIDTATNKIAAAVPVGIAPFAVAISPNGQHAYVTNGGSASVSVIDTTTNTVEATVIVGIGPYGVSVSPDGEYVYVTNFGVSTVSVIRAGLNMVVATVPVGNSPQGVAVTPNGQYVYVADFGAGTVSVISTATNRVVSTVTVECGPNDVAVTPDGCYVYVVNSGSGSVSVVDASTFGVVARVAGLCQPSGVAITPDGEYAYVTNLGGDWVSIISTATNSIVATVQVGRSPYGLAMTPDGRYAYVVNYDGASVSVVNALSAASIAPSSMVVPAGQLDLTAQIAVLTTDAQFFIPSCGGSISFAVNGTCTSTNFENNGWNFNDLRLDGSELLNNIWLSTNSNISVASIMVIQNSTSQTIQVSYLAENQGSQMLTFGPEGDAKQWRVINNNVSLPESEAWSVSSEGTINITGISGDVVVQQVSFGDFFGNGEAYSSLPFFEQHTVGVTLAAALVVTLVFAVIVKMKTKPSKVGETGC